MGRSSGIEVPVGRRHRRVDARDLRQWLGTSAVPRPGAVAWVDHALRYVEQHPRVAGDADAGTSALQRTAVLRRLAAGPATVPELLAAMRAVAGWVAAEDLANRLRELRGRRGRSHASRGVALVIDADGRYALAEPFPLLADADRRALGFAKALLAGLDGSLARGAGAALDRLLPGLSAGAGAGAAPRPSVAPAVLERFEGARADGQPVRVRYRSRRSRREGTYDVVPVEYVTVGPTVKALCFDIGADGSRGRERQLVLTRLLEATPLDLPALPAQARELTRCAIRLVVNEGLLGVMLERDWFGITTVEPRQVDTDAFEVSGSFPLAIHWDVMEQLCAWAGAAQVLEPLWLVNAVCRRLRHGLKVMEQGEDFTLIEPDPSATFESLGDAVWGEPRRVPGATKLVPRRVVAAARDEPIPPAEAGR